MWFGCTAIFNTIILITISVWTSLYWTKVLFKKSKTILSFFFVSERKLHVLYKHSLSKETSHHSNVYLFILNWISIQNEPQPQSQPQWKLWMQTKCCSTIFGRNGLWTWNLVGRYCILARLQLPYDIHYCCHKFIFIHLFETALYNDVEKLQKFIRSGHANDVDATGNLFCRINCLKNWILQSYS